MNIQLSAHFSLDELVASEIATRRGIDNEPDFAIITNLRALAAGLEHVRVALGYPIHVNSGYRCGALNRAVGGAVTSAHTRGLAADIICPGFGVPLAVCKAILAAGFPFQQIIFEVAWCHFAVPEPGTDAGRQLLTAHFAGGHATYTPGLA